MRRLDRLHLEFPFAGSRMLRGRLAAEGCKIGRRHVKTLMRRMGMEALYRRPRTTKPGPGHKIYPYLLRGIEIARPNQVWAMDITYIAMARGFVYLALVLDWFSRRVLSWRLSITMDAAFCVETLEDALARHGKREIFNTDQGSQFTGAAFMGALANNGIAISMDGKGAWRDNVFVERLWRSVKYEEVYLRAYDSVSGARSSLGRYLDFYNARRPHSSLDGMTPDQAYFTPLPLRLAAYVPQSAPWLPVLRSELLSFNAGKHEDIVDALGLIGQLLDTISKGRTPEKPEKPVDYGYRPYDLAVRDNDWLLY